jgi:hypothetical protein
MLVSFGWPLNGREVSKEDEEKEEEEGLEDDEDVDKCRDISTEVGPEADVGADALLGTDVVTLSLIDGLRYFASRNTTIYILSSSFAPIFVRISSIFRRLSIKNGHFRKQMTSANGLKIVYIPLTLRL